MKARRALISVHDTTGLVEFVRELNRLGIEVVAADETEQFLRVEGIDVLGIEQHVGAKALAGAGPLQSMHPGLTSAIMSGGSAGGDGRFDIVVVNLCPFERSAGRRDAREEDVVASIDLEAPAILRAAAKNFEHVVVVSDPEAYGIVIEELENSDGDPSYDARRLLASRAFDATAHYELAVASWFSEMEDFPTYLLRDYVKMNDLPFGENPHQRGAFYVEVGARRHLLSMVEQLQGSELTFNNLGDLNTARGVVGDFSVPACVIVKHGSPAGVAVSSDAAGAFRLAYSCNPQSVHGGVIAMNRQVDSATAQAISSHAFDAIFAPDYTDEALAIISEHMPDLRVLLDRERRKKSPGERDMRRVIGGLLVQDMDSDVVERDLLDVVTSTQPTEAQWGDLQFAWRVSKWVRSNAIVLAKDLATVGIGGGTPSRREGIEYALAKAGIERAKGAVLSSDAFLGYDDAVQAAIDAGIAGIIQPGGSRRDEEIISLCNKAGIPMVFTHRRHFRH